MLYLDTSAFLKLLVDEEHSSELRTALGAENVWSSSLLDVEAHLAGRRLGLPADTVAEHLDADTIFTPGERHRA
jgi:predicted nucleic acid-binding protein